MTIIKLRENEFPEVNPLSFGGDVYRPADLVAKGHAIRLRSLDRDRELILYCATFDEVRDHHVWFLPTSREVASVQASIPVHCEAIDTLGDITSWYFVGPLVPGVSGRCIRALRAWSVVCD